MEIYNRNLNCSVTTYKYRGYLSVTTFGADPGKNEPFYHSEDFECTNLLVAREKAINWFKQTIAGLKREGKYFLPFASPEDFIMGKNAAFSVVVSLVICQGVNEDEFDLLGTDDGTMEDTLELEDMILKQLYEIQ